MNLSKQEIEEKNEVIERIFSISGKGLSLGYPKIDNILGNVDPGETIILGGETGVGKSLFAMNIAVNVAKQGEKVLYLDLENGEKTGITRLLSIWSGVGIKYWDNPQSKEKAKETNLDMSNNIEYWDHISLETFKGFEENKWGTIINYIKSRSVNKDTKPRLIVIDPLQDMENEIESSTLYNEQGKMIGAFKNLCQKLHTNILICHHLRKPGSTNGRYVSSVDEKETKLYRIPEKDDFKGSSKITEKTQILLSIVRAYEGKTNESRSTTRIEVLKNRNGLNGVEYVYLNEDNLRFENAKVYTSEYVDLLSGLL